jgi:Ca2+-binding EF-hand superfamily protein
MPAGGIGTTLHGMYTQEEIEQLRPHIEDLFNLLDSDRDGKVDREALAVRCPPSKKTVLLWALQVWLT